jgi:hypothetical protein
MNIEFRPNETQVPYSLDIYVNKTYKGKLLTKTTYSPGPPATQSVTWELWLPVAGTLSLIGTPHTSYVAALNAAVAFIKVNPL